MIKIGEIEKLEEIEEYRKDLDKNYLMIKQSEKLEADYRLEMICRNNIPRYCKMTRKEFDGTVTFYYDVTEKIAIEKVCEKRKLKKPELVKLVMNIQEAVENARRFMLDTDKIILDIKHIYKNMAESGYAFCYFPGKTTSLMTSLKELMNELIKYVDHEDRETVIMAYGIQQLVQNEGIVLNDMIRFVNSDQFKEAYNISGEYRFPFDDDTIKIYVDSEKESGENINNKAYKNDTVKENQDINKPKNINKIVKKMHLNSQKLLEMLGLKQYN